MYLPLFEYIGIAGKITPAIATTTALVTGAICMEIYKIMQDKPVDKLANTFNNLALPLFTSMEPEPPKKTTSIVKGENWQWTAWDRIEYFDPAMTLTQLMERLEEDYGLEISMLSHGPKLLYSEYMNQKIAKERKAAPLKATVEAARKIAIPAAQKFLLFEVFALDVDSGDEVEIPYIRLRLY